MHIRLVRSMNTISRLVELFVSPQRNGFPILVAIIGLVFSYFGYDLFRSGIQDGGAAVTVSFGENRAFEMGKGGPGLIFCLFGMALIVYAIRKFDKHRVQPERKIGVDKDGRTYEIDEDGKKIYH